MPKKPRKRKYHLHECDPEDLIFKHMEEWALNRLLSFAAAPIPTSRRA
jgi:hypothetical protein